MRTWYSADERGSIIALTRDAGSLDGINAYDEFGRRQGAGGRFQYTGQMWLSELGLYFYKTRAFSATLGRFLQTDPIGYAAGPNLYAYVGNDPIGLVDSSGQRRLNLRERTMVSKYFGNSFLSYIDAVENRTLGFITGKFIDLVGRIQHPSDTYIVLS